MKRLPAHDILTLHTIAAHDKRTDKPSRILLAAIAREGRIGNLKTLAAACGIREDKIKTKLNRLVELGYLPAEAKR